MARLAEWTSGVTHSANGTDAELAFEHAGTLALVDALGMLSLPLSKCSKQQTRTEPLLISANV